MQNASKNFKKKLQTAVDYLQITFRLRPMWCALLMQSKCTLGALCALSLSLSASQVHSEVGVRLLLSLSTAFFRFGILRRFSFIRFLMV